MKPSGYCKYQLFYHPEVQRSVDTHCIYVFLIIHVTAIISLNNINLSAYIKQT